ncbi:tetratricopeptide repeat protein [Streptosporangium sp. NBC_01639]|uniref:tetratricopeptide repeat protein n=1 Tax=Streptosporangium sp. NBC_01639 TaxID=2975948 RepID=UPI0038651D34|nr:tetratricopeptide repeat protein [Streptosporangium sp. NBC_01639]
MPELRIPPYRLPGGAKPFARRLRALLSAGRPAACPVPIGLAAPQPLSDTVAICTHAIARHLVEGDAAALPIFNTRPPDTWRILTAASRNRPDAFTEEFGDLPADLASDLWLQVDQVCRDRDSLPPPALRAAADLLLRLGYPKKAAELLGMSGTKADAHRFNPRLAREEMSVLFRFHHDSAQLEQLALNAAADEEIDAYARLMLANFIVVRNGKRGTDTPEAHQAAELGRAALASLDDTETVKALAEHTWLRAVAYLPFLKSDVKATLAILDRAEECLALGRPSQGTLRILAWEDHATPLYETLAKTLILFGQAERAVAATDRLVELNPHDHRTWNRRGQALVAAGRIDEALHAFERTLPLGGIAVAEAAFHLGWVYEQLGKPDLARDHYLLSQRVDPTVDVVDERLKNLPQ